MCNATHGHTLFVVPLHRRPMVDKPPCCLNVLHHVEWCIAIIISDVHVTACLNVSVDEPASGYGIMTLGNEVVEHMNLTIGSRSMPCTKRKEGVMSYLSHSHWCVCVLVWDVGGEGCPPFQCQAAGVQFSQLRTLALNELLDRSSCAKHAYDCMMDSPSLDRGRHRQQRSKYSSRAVLASGLASLFCATLDRVQAPIHAVSHREQICVTIASQRCRRHESSRRSSSWFTLSLARLPKCRPISPVLLQMLLPTQHGVCTRIFSYCKRKSCTGSFWDV